MDGENHKYVFDILLLTLLQEEPMYGYDLRQKLFNGSDGLIQLRLSTIYPVLYRLTTKGYVLTEERNVGRKARVYYSITEAGREYLGSAKQEYYDFIDGVYNLLKTENDRRGESHHDGN